jgi:hypothetical protein
MQAPLTTTSDAMSAYMDLIIHFDCVKRRTMNAIDIFVIAVQKMNGKMTSCEYL